MRLSIALSALILSSQTLFARQPEDVAPAPVRKLAFKVYNLTTIRPTIKTGNYSFLHEYVEHDYLQPTVALRLETKRRNFHEVELSEFSLRKKRDRYVLATQGIAVTTSGTEVNTSAFAVRYEYTRPFFKKANHTVVPSIGVAGSLFYERFKTVPLTTAVYPVAETNAGMRGFIVPRLNFYAGKRLFFDLNVPVCLLHAGYQQSNQQNPTVPEQLQKMGLIKFDFLPEYYSFRIGAGWRF